MSTPDNPYGSAGQPYGSNDPQNTSAANGGYQDGQQNPSQEFGQGSAVPDYGQAASGQQGYGPQDFGQPSAQPGATAYPSYPGADNAAANDAGTYGAGGYPSSPTYGGVEMQERNTLAPWALGFAIFSVVCAVTIVGLAFAWLPAIVGLILSIIAIFRARKIQGPYRRMGMSVASLVITGIAVVFYVIAIIAISILMASSGEAIQKCQNDYPNNQTAQQECINRAVQDALGG